MPEDGGPVQAHGVVNTPGYHVLYTVRGVRRLVIATPEHLREPQRSWGWQVQLYAARSRDSWGIGDFRDLGQICRIAAQQGAQCVQVSPVHAIAPVSHPKDSPYSPASRHFLNLLHIAPGFAPGAERVNLSDLSARGRALNDERLIDRTAVWALKREALERIWQAVRDEPNIEFREFRRHRGRALTRFATWSAIAEDLDSPDWPDWPTELHNPEGVDVARYAHEHADRVNFFSWCQWVADWQYGRACTEGVDVIADLAVGFDRGSEDAWAFHGQLCFDFEIGAPPDEHNQDGQRWGLPPFSPQMEERTDFAAFRDMVARGLAHTHALRIDHVMQLWRLFWIPRDADPADGAYVHYPVHALLAILRLEAMRTNAWIVGEDMGTVAPGMRETMHGIGMLSNCSAVRTPIADFPELALGTSSTHDQVTIAGLLTGADAAELEFLLHVHVHGGPGAQVGGHHFQQPLVARVAFHADAQGAAFAAGKLAQAFFGVLQLGQQSVGHAQQVVPGLGGAQVAAFAVPDGRAQLVFQLADAMAEGRLGEVQAFGGGGQ